MTTFQTTTAMTNDETRAAGASPLIRAASRFVSFLSLLLALLRKVEVKRREKAMRLCETLPLGEKRMLAIVQVGNQRFLIGATVQSISLVQKLDSQAQPMEGRSPSSPVGTTGEAP